ncbi:MAG: HmuY family protein [Rikenellaceae bacterium]
MKRFFKIAIVVFAAHIIGSCSKIDPDDILGSVEMEGMFDVTSYTEWHYFAIVNGALVEVMTYEDDEVITENVPSTDMYGDDIISTQYDRSTPDEVKNNADWLFAVCRYEVRTNSGESSNNNGGLYTFENGELYDDVDALPSAATFEADYYGGGTQMTGEIIYKPLSTAKVADFAVDSDGNTIMPPSYVKSALYAVRSGDGNTVYALDFASYQNPANGYTGYATIQVKEITIE